MWLPSPYDSRIIAVPFPYHCRTIKRSIMSHPYTPYMPSFCHQVTLQLLLPYYYRTIPVQFPYNCCTIKHP